MFQKRTQLKLIISSATVDAEEICQFYNISASSNATILSVKGHLYPVSVYYSNDPVVNYVQGVVDTAIKIHESMPVGDILAFVIGLEQIEHIIGILKQYHNQREDLKLLILPMHGSLPNNEQIKVFRPTPRAMRKIVIATNIAETSITIPGIVYVIDPGFVKARWFNPNTLTNSLVVVPISKASAVQRAGRAGRVRSGHVYRLYTEASFSQLNECTPPEMQRTELSSAVLQLKALGIHNILRFSFPSPPPAQNLRVALELLYSLGAMDVNGNLTKPVGETMAEMPLHPIHAKVLLSSGDFECSDEIASILSLLQVQDIFIKPSSGALSLKARVLRRNFEVEQGDLLTLLNIFKFYEKQENKKQFCHKYFFNYKVLKRAAELKNQMILLLKKSSIPLVTSPRNTNAVLKCLTNGFFSNAAYLHYSGVYRTVRGNEDLYIHPSSVLYTLQQPQCGKTTVSESAETSSDCLPLPQFNPSEKRLSLREERDAAITTIMTKEQEKEQLEAEIIALKAELSESETVIQNLRKSRSTMEASWAADKMELETLRKRINTPVVISSSSGSSSSSIQNTSSDAKIKLTVIGDSHVHNLESVLVKVFPATYDIKCYAKSGSGIQDVCSVAVREHGSQDLVIVFAGTNYTCNKLGPSLREFFSP
ncbi:hypothetical protein M8J77_007630 [Diaphorina citri]|nr:hypothetical protein M8J77_007630 [Diaphorina citri]